jgi:hypothetical protein
MIGVRTALLLYTALLVTAVMTLTGKALTLALIIVFAFVAKTSVDYVRRKQQ